MTLRVAVVDDDEAVRDSLSAVLSTHGFTIRTYGTATDALDGLAKWKADCMVLDVRMPGMDGLELQRVLSGMRDAPPVILVTGHGDVAMAVQAIKNGASDFIEKPIDDEALAQSIRAAVAARQETARSDELALRAREHLALLTERERTVARMVAEGYSTMAIAGTLNISNRTVDHHRASIMAKMEATSLPQLMKLLLIANIQDTK